MNMWEKWQWPSPWQLVIILMFAVAIVYGYRHTHDGTSITFVTVAPE